VVDTAGDSALAVFDTASGAATAALAIQQELAAATTEVAEDRRMRFRIGVHLGDVIEKIDGSVYGDGVNIAARLQSLAEPGGVTISDAVRGAVRGKVAAHFVDQGEQRVKNIAEAVRVYRMTAGDVGKVTRQPQAAQATSTRGEIDLSLPDKPSIAVLAFANMSGDAEHEYFTDGITEDIITELSRFDSLFVIASHSSFNYKGKAIDVKQVGRELGVRYVVEGSIRRSGNRARVTAQLIDALTGNHIWAERYDREIQDIFAVQDEVTQCIVGAVAPHVDSAEFLRARRRPGNLSAYETAARAASVMREAWRRSDREGADEALNLARSALAIDRESLPALLVIGLAQLHSLVLRTATNRAQAWQEAMQAVTQAIALAQSGLTYGIKALLLVQKPGGGGLNEARIAGEMAYALNPSDFYAIFAHGSTLVAEDPTKAAELLRRALRINPRDPRAYLIYCELARAHLTARDYSGGLEWAQRAQNVAPGYVYAHLVMAMLQVGLGDLETARSAVEDARAVAPELVRGWLEETTAGGAEASGDRFRTLLRVAAGLEDPGAADAWR
jgi:adenylate cyclase